MASRNTGPIFKVTVGCTLQNININLPGSCLKFGTLSPMLPLVYKASGSSIAPYGG